VHATLADRDKIASDDNVQILLGTFHDHRQAYVFAVNPLGVQMDGTIVELGQVLTGAWTPTLSGRVAPDLSQDVVFSSKGRLTDYGYEIEIRVPLKSSIPIRRRRAGTSTSCVRCSIPARRFVGPGQAVEHVVPRTIRDARRAQRLSRGLVLDVNPSVTEKSPADRPEWVGLRSWLTAARRTRPVGITNT
jgi:hypothetical protein